MGEFQVTQKTFGYKFIWNFKLQTKVNKKGFYRSENLKVLFETFVSNVFVWDISIYSTNNQKDRIQYFYHLGWYPTYQKCIILWPIVVYFNRQEETNRLGLGINEKGKQIKCYYDQIQVSRLHKHLRMHLRKVRMCVDYFKVQ